jgi:hypothetical protein
MSIEEQDFAEKRDYIRMFINAPVDYSISGADDWKEGLGKDLSGGGFSFTTSHPLSAGDKVDIKLHPVTPVTPPLEAHVTVIRADDNGQGQFIVSTKIEKIKT